MPESYREQTARQVDLLRRGAWARLEREMYARRSAWWERRPAPTSVDLRAGFEALVVDYLGLDAADFTVRSETDSAIFWESRNRCPTLAACETLGLDTRIVCRRISEKPAQALLSRLDPRLRFVRDYSRLRPRAPSCLEGIVRVDLEVLMGIALEEARASRDGGDKGYGAAVALGAQVVARAHDTAVTRRDPSLHAEVAAIQTAARALGDADLCGALLVSTCEPCPMCSSLAVWANVTSIVFGASISATAQLGKARIAIDAAEVVSRGPALVEVIGGVRENECLALYR